MFEGILLRNSLSCWQNRRVTQVWDCRLGPDGLRSSVVANVRLHQHLVVQQVEHRCDDANHEHNGYRRRPPHSPVRSVVRVLPHAWSALCFSLSRLLGVQRRHHLAQTASGRAGVLNQQLNVLVLLLQEALHTIGGGGGRGRGICGTCTRWDLRDSANTAGRVRFAGGSRAVRFREQAKFLHRDFDGPQGEEVLLR